MNYKFTESVVEEACLQYFGQLDYQYLSAPEIACDGVFAERADYGDTILKQRLRAALVKINPAVPAPAIEEAVRKVTRTESPTLVINNRAFHRLLTDGIPVEVRQEPSPQPSPRGRGDGGEDSRRYEVVRLFDFDNPDANDWLVVNQFTVVENHVNRRTDVVVFVNGLPLAVIELKNPADEQATVRGAYNQLQTYKAQVPGLFTCNEMLVVSDGHEAKIGTLTADWERFSPWRTVDETDVAPASVPQLETLIKGVFEKSRFLDIVRSFIVFEENAGDIVKKLAGYHQFHAVNLAVAETVRASSPKGDQRIGVVWHTQGSGKSLSMIFYARKIILHPTMENPTLVLLTDRNDLDGQLFNNFALGKDLLRQTPVRAESREHLKELLKVVSGGGSDTEKDVDKAVKQLVARSVTSNEVIDIFKAVGLDKPDISILSDEFLKEVQKMPQKNLAAEVFKKLMRDAIVRHARSNLVQSRLFSEMLDKTIRQYQNRTIEVAQVISELVKMAKDFKQAMGRGEELGLNDAELAFYDSLETNDSAVMELGDETLKAIARDLVQAVRTSVTIDWTMKESVRAKIRTLVKRILRKYDYPPDKQEKATMTVLQQAELLCGDWTEQPAA